MRLQALFAVVVTAGISTPFLFDSTSAAVQTTPGAAGVKYAVDSVHSTALFRTHHLGAGQFWGRFNDLAGTIEVDENDTPITMSITIDVDSVDTNNERLDRHLKSPDFFSAREHPEMSFSATSIEPAGDGVYKVTGNLSMRGTIQEISAEVQHTGTSNAMGGRIGFEARFDVKRSEFGIMYGVENGAVGDEVKVIVGLEAQKAESG